MIGSTVAHYKVNSKLGEGGMGEVWRAEDTKLGREVAMKMLPVAFAQDPERLARFEREARVLASLSHANLAAVYGLEDVGGERYLIMELAEGEDLSQILQQRGALPVEEAMRIAVQIAEGMEAAHEKGIVHRDLKPANVVVDPSGGVKILDFGLAKALSSDADSSSPGTPPSAADLAMSPTLTRAMTGVGVLLGTAGYMSPEQARGQRVDRRSDIWAFGCVLYEMLTGQRLYTGDTVTDVIGAIVHKEPDLDELPADVSPRIRRVLRRCLQKDVRRRLQSIGDARIALQEWMESPQEEVAPAAAEALPQPGWQRWLPWAVAAGAALIALLQGLGVLGGGRGAAEPIRRSMITVEPPGLFSDLGAAAVLSPDGSRIAMTTGVPSVAGTAADSLVLRSLDQFETNEVAAGGVGETPYHPFFSPDGSWLGYVTPSELKKVSVAGGAAITLTDIDRSRGASWGEDGTIVFASSATSGLSLISAAGGNTTEVTTLSEDEMSHRWPQWLPGGKAVLFTVVPAGAVSPEESTLEVLKVESGERKVLHNGGYYGRYVPTGHVIYMHEGSLFALPFDLRKLQGTGSPMPVLEGVATSLGETAAQFDVSANGTLVYVSDRGDLAPFPVVRADRNGRVAPLWDEPGLYGNPAFSPDGRRLSMSVMRGDDWDVWIFDLDRTVATRLTFSDSYDADQVWSPDGRFLVFTSGRDGENTLYRKAADGSGEAEVLLAPGTLPSPYATDWSPDGQWIIAVTQNSDLYLVPADGGEPKPFQTTEFREFDARFSPDGRWIAYSSSETGRSEIYVRGFPLGGGKWQVSDGGGDFPRWASGRELLWRTDEGVMSVAVDGEGENFAAGTPRQLISGAFLGGLNGVAVRSFNFPDYDVAPDGQSLVFFSGEMTENRPTSVRMVTGWFEELRRLTTAGNN